MKKLCQFALVAGFWIVSACGGSGGYSGGNPTGPGTGGNINCPANNVCMGSAAFVPTSITVTKGTLVTFNNTSVVDHNIVFDAPLPAAVENPGSLPYGSSVGRTFATAGTYNFHCTIHGGMTGMVIAQ
jgi:plastocyanin